MSEMTIERAAEVLKAHNKWRRDVTDNPPATTRNMQDPEDIGKAIDVAVIELENANHWKSIDTAPTDRIILLYRPKAAHWGMVTPGKWNGDGFAKHPKPFWEIWFKIGTLTESRLWVPTHWKDLPSAEGIDSEEPQSLAEAFGCEQ